MFDNNIEFFNKIRLIVFKNFISRTVTVLSYIVNRAKMASGCLMKTIEILSEKCYTLRDALFYILGSLSSLYIWVHLTSK